MNRFGSRWPKPTRGAIVFGTILNDAEEQWPGRNQLLAAIAEHVPVVFLERRRSRSSSRTRLEEWCPGKVFIARNAFPLTNSRLGHSAPAVAYLDAALLRSALRSGGFSRYLLWLTSADPRLTYGTAPSRLIYDCADPNFLPEEDIRFRSAEDYVARRSILTFSTAHSLQRRMQALNMKSFLLPNATSPDFHPDATAQLPRPAELLNRDTPVLGYLGTIDWRFSSEYVEVAAKANPDWTFAIVGRINPDQEGRVRGLRNLPNVILPGQVDYEAGRSWVSSFDVGMIPFVPGPINDAINPVKMYMYLMAGIPVVSTDVEECRRNPFVVTAADPESFSIALSQAVSSRTQDDRDRRTAFAMENTWAERAHQALKLLEAGGISL